MRLSRVRLLAILAALGFAAPAVALVPNEIFVIANKNVPASKQVADYYCAKRAVPSKNVILLDLPTTEDINRTDYDRKLVTPLRAALKDRKDSIKCLLTVYGVPLRVGGASPNDDEKAELKKVEPDVKKLQGQIADVQKQIKAAEPKGKKDGPDADALKQLRKDLSALQAKLTPLENKRKFLSHAESQAAVDSELMLLWWDNYELRRWQVNPLYFQAPEFLRKGKPPVLMTCRLDGPTPEIAKRLVDDSLAAEKKGLTGKVYIDARGIRYDPKGDPGFGYGGYDESFRETAALLKQGGMTVVLDDKNGLFPVGSCGECALYAGWYSHANFVDCCKFVPGAVAWHLASSEAVSLRRKDTKLWCRNLLEKGAAATLGPVAEPYTVGFPKPAEFFGFLATGKYTLAETYARTVMLTSWMGVLVGDPLYNPFAANPRLKEEQVQPSPKGGRFMMIR